MILKPVGTAGILSAVCKTAMFAVSSPWNGGLSPVQSVWVLVFLEPANRIRSRGSRVEKVGNLVLVFHFFHPRSARAVGMWKSRGVCEISKERWERVESLPLAFHGFHRSVISTAPFPDNRLL